MRMTKLATPLFVAAEVDDCPQQYVRLAFDLCSAESSCGDEEKARIMANVTRLFETGSGGDPKVPGAEPGLTTKADRAAVGAASKAWTDMLKKSHTGDPVEGWSALGWFFADFFPCSFHPLPSQSP